MEQHNLGDEIQMLPPQCAEVQCIMPAGMPGGGASLTINSETVTLNGENAANMEAVEGMRQALKPYCYLPNGP